MRLSFPPGFARYAALAGLTLLAGCKTELYSGVPEQEANQMVAVLLEHNIGAEKTRAKDGSETVMVDRSDFGTAISLLDSQQLPRKKFDTIDKVLPQGGLVASPAQDRARYLYLLGQQLSSTISEIDGVLTARVQVVLPDNDIMQRVPTPSSASVFIRYDTRTHVDQLVPQIKMLVANSVQGLSYDKVSVILIPVARALADAQAQAAAEAAQGSWATVIEVLAVLLLAIAGAGFYFRQRLAELISRRGGLPALWSGSE